VFSGTISGSGEFQQIGTGTTDLTAADSVAGPTVIESGILQLGIGGSIANNVLFAGAPATLRFDTNSTQLGGNISGMASNDAIDFGYAAFDAGNHAVFTQAGSSGTLALVNGVGTTLGSVTLVGQYTTADFTTVDDGVGGTTIIDPHAVEQVTVASGGVAEIGAPSAAAVTFAGSSGTLQLDQSAGFAGTVAGFGAQDHIDLGDLAFSANTSLGFTANGANSGGSLMVSNGGTTANITLLGNYIASTFVTSSDGHGGTMISEAAMTAQTPPLTQPHANA
jgi:hypothetical protein